MSDDTLIGYKYRELRFDTLFQLNTLGKAAEWDDV